MPGFTYGGSTGATYGGENGSAYGTPRPRQVKNLAIEPGDDPETELDLSWDAAGSAKEYVILRATDSGDDSADYTEVDTTADTSYTDTGRTNGREYHYRVVGRNVVGDGPLSAEATETTALPDPVIDGFETDTQGEITVELSIPDDNDDGDLTIERDGDEITTLSDFDASSYTDDDSILDGEQYEYQLVRDTGDATASSATDDAIAFLPDEDQPVLGNGVEDEISVDREDEVSNNGDVRIQIRETGTDSWDSDATGFGEFIGDYDTLEMEFVDREDGEEYEVRARTETEHVDGAWTDPVAITAKFPGATDFEITSVGETSVEMEWVDNADNEDGQYIVREKRVSGEWWPERIVDDAGADTESYTDDTAQPDTEYRYRVRPYTEHTDADSETDTATTDDIGLPRRRIPASGWRVEIEHPSGTTLTPTVLADDTEWVPRLNDLPRVRVAVPKSDRWEDGALEGEPIRVWKDGVELPIEEIRSIERETDMDVIEAAGGVALEDDIEGFQIAEADADEAATEVIEDELGWAADVDDPEAEAREDISLFFAGDTGDFEENVTEEPAADDPWEIFGNAVSSTRVASFTEAEDADTDATTYFADNEGEDGGWSGNQTKRLEPGDTIEFDLPVDHEIPEGECVLEWVYAMPEEPTPALDISFNPAGGSSEVVEEISEETLLSSDDKFDMRSFDVTLNDSEFGDLEAGTHRVEIEHVSGENMYVDFGHVRDDRFEYDTSQTNADDEVVEGWEQFPEAIDVEFETLESVEQIVEATVDVEMDSTEGEQALGLRADGADDYDEGTNTESHTFEPDDPSQTIQARVTLGRSDTGSNSGDFGAEGQELDQIRVEADLVNTPVVLDLVHEGTYKRLLERIADSGDFVWEVRVEEDGDEPYRIEWTQPGQRVADREPALVDYSGRRTIEGSYQRVIAQGKSATVEEETFTSNDEFDLLTGLDESPIETGSETVYDVDDRSAQYDRNIDYELDYREGAIRVLEGGDMDTDTEYMIDYEWRYEGRYTDPGHDEDGEPRTLRESFPDAASDRECEQLALAVVREVAEPREEATVTIRDPAPDRSLVEALDPDELPFEGPLRVRSVNNDARSVELTVGSRRDAADIVDDLNTRLEAVARNV